MQIATDWNDYELIDAGDGEKLERWGPFVLRRPDPQAIWPKTLGPADWNRADARYLRSSSGGGHWEFRRPLPERWTIAYGSLSFYIRPTGFKHTGLFPEQAVNWNWLRERLERAGRPIRALNLFAYTGGATLACAAAGAEVCHVDAAKGIVQWAKENLQLSGLGNRPVRFLVDDALKFVQREKRRGRTYDVIVLDPPSYGRGPGGEVWKLEDDLYRFLEACAGLLSDRPLLVLLNSYTTGLSPAVLGNLLALTFGKGGRGRITTDEIGLPVGSTGLVLPAGAFGRWEAELP